VYYISQFVSALNVALAASYAAVIAANTTDYQLYAGHAPYFVFNSTTDLLSLIVDSGVWTTGTATLLPLIYFNTPLSVLLSGVPQYEVSVNAVGGLDDYVVIDPNNLGNDSTQPAAQFFVTSNTTYAKNVGAETKLTTQAIPFALPVGATLLYTNSTLQAGYQTLVVATAVASGATSITVNSFIPSFAFAPGDQIMWLPPAQLSINDEASSVASWFNAYSVAVLSQMMPFRTSFAPSTQLAAGTSTAGTLSPQPIVADFRKRCCSSLDLTVIPTHGSVPWHGKIDLHKVDSVLPES
jgi:hypothetical protein